MHVCIVVYKQMRPPYFTLLISSPEWPLFSGPSLGRLNDDICLWCTAIIVNFVLIGYRKCNQIDLNAQYIHIIYAYVRHDGALVETTPFDRKVVGSNPAIVAVQGPGASPLLAVACGASACKLRHSVNCCGRERF